MNSPRRIFIFHFENFNKKKKEKKFFQCRPKKPKKKIVFKGFKKKVFYLKMKKILTITLHLINFNN